MEKNSSNAAAEGAGSVEELSPGLGSSGCADVSVELALLPQACRVSELRLGEELQMLQQQQQVGRAFNAAAEAGNLTAALAEVSGKEATSAFLRSKLRRDLARAVAQRTLAPAWQSARARCAFDAAAANGTLTTALAEVCNHRSEQQGQDHQPRVLQQAEYQQEEAQAPQSAMGSTVCVQDGAQAPQSAMGSTVSVRDQAVAVADSTCDPGKTDILSVVRAAASRAVASAVDAAEDKFAERRLAAKRDLAKIESEKLNPFWFQEDCPLRTTDWRVDGELHPSDDELPPSFVKARDFTKKAIGYAFAVLCPAQRRGRSAPREQVAVQLPPEESVDVAPPRRKERRCGTVAFANLGQVYFHAVKDADVKLFSADIASRALRSVSSRLVQNAVDRKAAVPYLCRVFNRAAPIGDARSLEQQYDLANAVAKDYTHKWVQDCSSIIDIAAKAALKSISDVTPQAISMAIEVNDGRICRCGSVFKIDAVFCRICGLKRPVVPNEDDEDDGLTSARYLVDNRQLQANSAGLAFRFSKRLSDKAGSCVSWGDHVRGIDLGDGWLRVLKHESFGRGILLPMEHGGVSVVTLAPKEPKLDEKLSSSHPGLLMYEFAGESLGRCYKKGLSLCLLRAQQDAQRREEEAEAARAAAAEPKIAYASTLAAFFERRTPTFELETWSDSESAGTEEFIGIESPISANAPAAGGARMVSTAPASWPGLPWTPDGSRMARQESFKRLSSLYGPAADVKLAEKPETAASMWSARSTTAGVQGGGASSSASPGPTAPSTAKPAKATPAHRLAQRAQCRPDHRSAEEQESIREGRHLVNPKHDPDHLRALDQQKLRRKFLKNMQSSKAVQNQTRQSGAVLQEYYWRMRDMEVEKKCRTTEKQWQQKEKVRRAGTERKRNDIAEQSDEALNLRYGRIFAAPYIQPMQMRMAEPAQSRPQSEMDMDAIWEAEALSAFQAAYHGAVGRFVSPTPTDEMPLPNEEVVVSESSESVFGSEGRGWQDVPVPTSKLRVLPRGRVEWSSPRNPWNVHRTGAPPPVQAVVATLLAGERPPVEAAPPAARPGKKRPQTQQSLSRWRQLPPVVPQRAIQELDLPATPTL